MVDQPMLTLQLDPMELLGKVMGVDFPAQTLVITDTGDQVEEVELEAQVRMVRHLEIKGLETVESE